MSKEKLTPYKTYEGYLKYQDSLVQEEDKEEYEEYKKKYNKLDKIYDECNKAQYQYDVDSEERIKLVLKTVKILRIKQKIKEIIEIFKDKKYNYDKVKHKYTLEYEQEQYEICEKNAKRLGLKE